MREERRRFTRVLFRVKAEVTAQGIHYEAEEIRNLSAGGCLLAIGADLEPETPCQVRILLTGTDKPLDVTALGKVVRSEGGRIAVKFTETDPESLFHLRSIVLYNSEDPEGVEQELRENPGLR
ncbi:MAG: PilZ domain-containing protein [Deltaproteobacteria bacterium]|nr:PilZ domain-containing protein [Deltaproteobacteria bacterium]